MTNPYYNGGSVPGQGAPGQSAAIRAEFSAISAAFDKMPTISGMPGAALRINSGASAIESFAAEAGGIYFHGPLGMTTAPGLTYDENGKVSIAEAATGDTLAVGGDVTIAGALAVAGRITGVTNPVDAQDAATKAYVDSVSTGLNVLAACRVATTANITLSGTQTIDGVAVVAGNRVLVKNQTTSSQNGIYVCAAGAWSRATDADSAAEIDAGAFVFVTAGTTQANTGWTQTQNVTTLGTDAIAWAQFSGAATYTAGTGLTLAGTQFSITATGVSAGSYGSATSVPAITVNAQGQITAVTATTIALNAGTHITTGTLADARLSANIPRLDQANSWTGNQSVTGNVAATAQVSGATLSISGTGTINTLQLGSALGIAYGGTGATTAAAARSALGLAIGTDVPSPTGTGASGTWGISISGNAATASAIASQGALATKNTVNNADWSGTALAVANGGTGSTTASAARTALGLVIGTNVPSPTGSGASGTWGISITGNAATATVIASQGALATKNTVNNADWSGTALAVANGGTGSTTAAAARSALGLAIGTDVPSPTGTGASGTWGISISGNAATASAIASQGALATKNTVNNADWSGTALAVANGGTGSTTASAARTALGLVIGTNVPSPTGSGASGTWGISISGNAATATNATNLGGSPASAFAAASHSHSNSQVPKIGNLSGITIAADPGGTPSGSAGDMFFYY